ncbi:MAG: nuclear transport factor 2 family protein [Myxococcota bacterium]
MACLALLALAAPGCKSAMIENTEIPDNENTRAIYERVMEYRVAMEARDVDAILAMVSRDYYENAGTTDRDSDDYGYDTLRDTVLPKLRTNIKAVQYRVLMRRIEVDKDHATADFEYFYRFKFVEGGHEAWTQKNDFNRLEFVREADRWMIVGGL